MGTLSLRSILTIVSFSILYTGSPATLSGACDQCASPTRGERQHGALCNVLVGLNVGSGLTPRGRPEFRGHKVLGKQAQLSSTDTMSWTLSSSCQATATSASVLF